MRIVAFLALMAAAIGAVYLHISHPWPWLWGAAAVFALLGVAVFWKDIRNGKHNK